MSASPPPPPSGRWIRNLGLVSALMSLVALVPAVRGDGSEHNDPGPGNCSHRHGYFNTSQCTVNGTPADGASCNTADGGGGTCKTQSQQCYCVRNTGVVVADAGAKPIGDPPFPHDYGFGGPGEDGNPGTR